MTSWSLSRWEYKLMKLINCSASILWQKVHWHQLNTFYQCPVMFYDLSFPFSTDPNTLPISPFPAASVPCLFWTVSLLSTLQQDHWQVLVLWDWLHYMCVCLWSPICTDLILSIHHLQVPVFRAVILMVPSQALDGWDRQGSLLPMSSPIHHPREKTEHQETPNNQWPGHLRKKNIMVTGLLMIRLMRLSLYQEIKCKNPYINIPYNGNEHPISPMKPHLICGASLHPVVSSCVIVLAISSTDNPKVSFFWVSIK